jgi:hypothetical protein
VERTRQEERPRKAAPAMSVLVSLPTKRMRFGETKRQGDEGEGEGEGEGEDGDGGGVREREREEIAAR